MKRFSVLAPLHGMAVLGIGFWWVWSRRHARRTAQVLAYVCACEVLWRMTDEDNHLPYMFGKYAVFVLLAVALYRQGKQVPALPLLYFGLLLPSSVLTIAHDGLSIGRQWLANDLSGPLAIAVCLAWFSQASLTRERVLAMLLAFLGPTAGVAFLCYSGTFGASEITFGMSSSDAASGGFGPNQVSATLGFGILCALLAIVIGRVSLKMKLILAGAVLWFAVQSALTYSRTGLYLAALSCVVASLPMLRTLRTGLLVIGLAIGLFVVSDYFILPALDRFTDGGLSVRFRNTDPTSRGGLIRAELATWAAHPLFGAGVGQGRHLRRQYTGISHAHTEVQPDARGARNAGARRPGCVNTVPGEIRNASDIAI